MILFQRIKLTSLRYSVSLYIPCDNFNCQRFRAGRCLIGHLHDGFTLLLLLSESFRVFSSRAKLYGFCYLNVTRITKFRYEIKNEMNSGALTIYTNDPGGNLVHEHKTIKI